MKASTTTMLFEWMTHCRAATVGFIIIHLTCLDLSWAYSCLCHSRRWDVRLDVFADLATTFLVLNWSIRIFWVAKISQTKDLRPEDKEVVMAPGQPGPWPRVNLPLVKSASAMLFFRLPGSCGSRVCLLKCFICEFPTLELRRRSAA